MNSEPRNNVKINQGMWHKHIGTKLNNHNLMNRKGNKKPNKINPMLGSFGNAYTNKGIDPASRTNKFYRHNLPSLPVSQIGNSKKVYKCSEMSNIPHGKVMAHGLYSNQGTVRPYNEDRVIEYHTVLKDSDGQEINFSYFGVYDGHGGQH